MKPLRKEECVLAVCEDRKWMVDLRKTSFGTHFGALDLMQVVGRPEGVCLDVGGKKVYFFRPTTEESLLRIKRRTQVMYPKDLGILLLAAGVRTEDHVIETGTGSGALLISLLTLVRKGTVLTIDREKEFQEIAQQNVCGYFGKVPRNVRFLIADVCEETFKPPVRKRWANRLFLDLPEPWRALNLLDYLQPGGVVTVFSPQITQIQTAAVHLRKRSCTDVQVFEMLRREWLVDERRARPADIMRGHTGFILIARKIT